MGNFNLKSIWKQTGGTGGSTNLEQRVQNIETNYFKKNGNAHQIVNNSADFYANVVLKRNGYVDNVDTNGPTSMINKQYLEQQLTATKNQIRSENNTFTGTNTFNTGANALTYTSTNTNKDLREVMVRNDMNYIKILGNNGFNVPANGYQTAEFVVQGLTIGLNEFYVVITTSSVDIGFDLNIQCNNLNYPNLSDIKTISTSNWVSSNIDNIGYVQIGFVVYGNNKIRFRAKNLHNQQISFNGFRIYKRIPSRLSNS